MLVVFEVHLSDEASAARLLSDEVKRETQAQMMTLEEAKLVGFGGLPAEPKGFAMRFVAVSKRDSGWIAKVLEASQTSSGFALTTSMDEPSEAAAEAGRDGLLALSDRLERYGSVLVCYSGGVDSAVVLSAAVRLAKAGKIRAIGMIAVSPSLAPRELDDARRVAASFGADLREVSSAEIDNPDYQRNGADRCFHCKTELYGIAEKKRAEWGLSVIANGTNLDDLGDYRPGLVAAENASVRSPFVELGLKKDDVRAIAKALDLPVWNKPAAACLSSRLAFGTTVTRERLGQVAELESVLYELGFRGHRVRLHTLSGSEQPLARIELREEDLALSDPVRREISARAKALGFLFVTLDLDGYQVGSHNRVLRQLPVLP